MMVQTIYIVKLNPKKHKRIMADKPNAKYMCDGLFWSNLEQCKRETTKKYVKRRYARPIYELI